SDDEFRVLDFKHGKTVQTTKKKRQVHKAVPPRELKMSFDQDWTSAWPGQRTFHPASVPLPVRQGISKLGTSPGKFGNAELMKIPNFLHLTPPAVKKHCVALKKFCTPWPDDLKTDTSCREHFPIEITTSNFCHSSPSIRNPLSRIVTIKVPLSVLNLDKHAKDKFLRLVGERYDERTGIVTITTDKCPLKEQNYDYAFYLLAAVFHESWITEPWEKEKSEVDMEYYDWDRSRSKSNVEKYIKSCTNSFDVTHPTVKEYKEAVVTLFDQGTLFFFILVYL
ncbi:hypothetical protein AAG570_012195, partial [Ranatra chinensis]